MAIALDKDKLHDLLDQAVIVIDEDIGAVFVYDGDLHSAARAHQLNPLAPQ